MEHKSVEQLKLYGTDGIFTIKAKNFETGEVKIFKNQTAGTFLKSLSYLKYLNAAGYNVFLSPACKAGGVFVLLDDVKKPEIDRLYRDGFEPFYYLETSPDNCQVIIKLTDNSISKELQTFISKQLAELYGADTNSADIGHFFRLAGFTNKKEKYQKGGLYPFVKLYPGIGKPCSKGKEYTERIRQGIKSELIELSEPLETTTPPACYATLGEKKGGAFEYIKRVYSSGNSDDISGLDFRAAFYAIRKGFTQDEIRAALLKCSPDIQNRKKGHIDDYINRTINAAYTKTHTEKSNLKDWNDDLKEEFNLNVVRDIFRVFKNDIESIENTKTHTIIYQTPKR